MKKANAGIPVLAGFPFGVIGRVGSDRMTSNFQSSFLTDVSTEVFQSFLFER